MITYLRLKNFRRHAETEIHFDESAQIILIAGDNGVGKTTLLEAMLFALYGVSRHGRRQLDNLIRRGAELEGMEVECAFTQDGTPYRVVRRRDSKVGTAILYGNDQPLTQGTDAVTDEIERIFGMDDAGFRLAVVAQQKQLDGLASLRPTERAAMLGRLLRLDAVSKAHDRARSIYRVEVEVLRSLGESEDVATLERTLVEAERTEREYAELTAALAGDLAQAQASRTSLSDVEARWSHLQLARSRAEGALSAAGDEWERWRQRAVECVVPEPVEAPEPSVIDLRAEQELVTGAIARAESAERLEASRRMLMREEDELTAQLVTWDTEELPAPEHTRLGELRDEIHRLNEDVDVAASAAAVARALVEELERKIDEAGDLGGFCEHCGQSVSPEHRETHLAALRASCDAARADAVASDERARRDRERLAAARATERDLAGEVVRREQLARERREAYAQAERRLGVTRDQLARLGEPDTADLAELQRHRADLARALGEALAQEEARRVYLHRLEERRQIDVALAESQDRYHALERSLAELAPDDDLLARHGELVELDRRATDLAERLNGARTQAAVASERRGRAQSELDAARARGVERARHERTAVVAANTADILGALGAALTARVRPLLESSVSEILHTLSDGRFSAVQIDEDYGIKVLDDGTFRSLGDCSGGEIDLIALAVRLALASVVADRHGEGPGFLVLDEVFGSQDSARRLAITGALRNLRHLYGQVFLISHVGGLEDEADTVLALERSVVEDEVPGVSLEIE